MNGDLWDLSIVVSGKTKVKQVHRGSQIRHYSDVDMSVHWKQSCFS